MPVRPAAAIGILLLHGCAPVVQVGSSPTLAPQLEVSVLGPSTDNGQPAVQQHTTSGMLTITGVELQRSDGVLRAELGTHIPGELEVVFYDSVPGQRVPLEPAPGVTQVRYQVRVAPLASGSYRVRLGRVEVGRNAVVLEREPREVRVP
jgi:hypothetical protein